MKVSVLTGIRQLGFIEREAPTILNADDVLIRIDAVGICGSDIHYYTEGNIGSQVVQYPFVIGHEAAGTVVGTGVDVKSVITGDRIAIEPTLWCGYCEQCLSGRKHTCMNQKFLGCPGQIEGALKEYIVLPEKCCFQVKNDMPFGLAVFAEPLSIGIYAMHLSGFDIPKAKIAILGAGPIGQSVLAACIKSGAKNVFVSDKLDYRLGIAARLGATYTANASEKAYTESVTGQFGSGFNVVFECCGKQEAVDLSTDLLKPGGKLMMVGIPEVERISLQIDKGRRKEICFQNVRRQNESFHEAIELIESDRSYFSPLITHHLPFAEAKNGFDMVASYSDNVMKAIITIP